MGIALVLSLVCSLKWNGNGSAVPSLMPAPHSLGDPRFNGGATSANACHKLNRFVQSKSGYYLPSNVGSSDSTSSQLVCDQFNVPIVNFVDCPGFAVGTKAEAAGMHRFYLWLFLLKLNHAPQ